jgi:hypothetical protein
VATLVAPPPVQRGNASSAEVEKLSAALGVRTSLGVQDAVALLDPRGLRFQRLEWLGDSLLDHLTALHRVLVAEQDVACCADRSHSQLVSDRDLARAVRTSGLVPLLDWTPSAHRQADLVEACVAAAWLAGGWPDAVAAAAVLVHRPLAACTDVLVSGADPGLAEPDCGTPAFRRLAGLGSHVMEAAASTRLFHEDPGDEGELTARRHPMLAGRNVQHRAAVPAAGCPSRELDHRVDHVQAAVGREQLRAGADRALALARECLGRS